MDDVKKKSDVIEYIYGELFFSPSKNLNQKFITLT